MKNTLLLITILIFTYSCSTTQDVGCKNKFLVVNYNVENLFDTIDDPHKIDNAFLPEGKKHWNTKRYNDKQEKLAKVLQSIDAEHLPDIIGLVEIENRAVLEDLISQKALKKGNYKIIHHESPDARGIDCAMLYNSKTFEPLHQVFYKVKMKDNKRFKTREIVYVKGKTKADDEIHVFVNHWPSRRGGQEKSTPKRALAARVLRHAVDSILRDNFDAKIIIIGDFNDETTNRSIKNILGASADINDNNSQLFNMAAKQDADSLGSYHYWKTKEWNMLDQMIISKGLLNAKTGLRATNTEMMIYKPEWILHTDKKGMKSPSKTYGKGYYGGYSDHLPIYQYFMYKCK